MSGLPSLLKSAMATRTVVEPLEKCRGGWKVCKRQGLGAGVGWAWADCEDIRSVKQNTVTAIVFRMACLLVFIESVLLGFDRGFRNLALLRMAKMANSFPVNYVDE